MENPLHAGCDAESDRKAEWEAFVEEWASDRGLDPDDMSDEDLERADADLRGWDDVR